MGYIWLIPFIIASLLTISYYLLNSASMHTFSVNLSLQLHISHYWRVLKHFFPLKTLFKLLSWTPKHYNCDQLTVLDQRESQNAAGVLYILLVIVTFDIYKPSKTSAHIAATNMIQSQGSAFMKTCSGWCGLLSWEKIPFSILILNQIR